jgi:hypothetical protein
VLALVRAQLLINATTFCKKRGLPLVVKIHPHLTGKPRAGQVLFVRELQRHYSKVYLSASSINFLAINALFTVTLNGGTLMDNFYTTTPVLTLARGFFSETDVLRGLRRMVDFELPWSEHRKLRQRQVVCWYDRHSLKASNTGAQNVAVLQAHIDAILSASAGSDRLVL